jgi:hypothetical protein
VSHLTVASRLRQAISRWHPGLGEPSHGGVQAQASHLVVVSHARLSLGISGSHHAVLYILSPMGPYIRSTSNSSSTLLIPFPSLEKAMAVRWCLVQLNQQLLTSLSLTHSNGSSAEPHVAVSGNNCTVKFFDINVHRAKGVDGPPKHIHKAGMLRLDMPMNHCASPLSAIPPITAGLEPL